MEDSFSVQPYLTDVLLLTQTAKQIKKDFAFFDLSVEFSGNTENAYQELFSQILPHIKELLDTNFPRFLSLLYRIDINEKFIKNTGISSEEITDLIIKRCLQKVVLRKLYS